MLFGRNARPRGRGDTVKMKFSFISVLRRACVIFTVASALFAVVILAAYASSESGANLSAARLLLMLPFALFFSLGEELFAAENTPGGAKIFLHAGLVVSGSFFFLVLPATADRDGAEKLTGFIITFVVYAVWMLIRLLFRKRLSRMRSESEKYKKK